MKRVFYGITGFAIVLVSFLIYQLFIFPNQKHIFHTYAAGMFGTDTNLVVPPREGIRGTETYPFVILEIVPYEGYAEIGYMIEGAEPVAWDKMKFDNESANLAASVVPSIQVVNGSNTDTIKSVSIAWGPEYAFDIAEGEVIGTNESLGHWKVAGTERQYGYFQKVNAEEGNFIQELNGTLYSYTEVDEGEGNYLWIPYEKNEPDITKVTDHNSNQVHTYRERTKYQRYRNYYTHRPFFLMNTLSLTEEQAKNYKVRVITMTPEQLNNPVNYPWIERADLISISPKEHVGGVKGIFERCYPEKKVSNPAINFSENDLNWEVIERIIRKAAQNNSHYAPVLFDVTVYNDKGYGGSDITVRKKYSTGQSVNLTEKGVLTNVAKLYMIMQQMRPEKFVQDYLETGLVVSIPMKNSSGAVIQSGTVPFTTGYFKEVASSPVTASSYYSKGNADSAAVWNLYTLLPYHMFPNNHGYDWHSWDIGWKQVGIENYRVIVDGGASNKSIRNSFLSYNGDNSLNQILLSSNMGYNKYTKEAFDYYNLSSGSITPASGIYYLLSKSPVTYDNHLIRILEIEPFNDFIWDGTRQAWNVVNNTSNGSAYARAYYKKFIPNYRGNISITTMTSSEFIGKIEDLNNSYDMILFGLRDGSTKESTPFSRYNESDLYGKLYLHNGDIIKQGNNKLKGLPDTNSDNKYRFSGNDITEMKYKELIDFMEAGKAVVLDTGFYTDSERTAVNTTKIAKDSYIYDLAYLNRKGQTHAGLFYADDTITSRLEAMLGEDYVSIVFGNKEATIPPADWYPLIYRDKSKSEYSGLDDVDIFINGVNSSFRTLQYKFYIDSDRGASEEYTVKLYIDLNADGKYDEIENVDNLVIVNDSGTKIDHNKLKGDTNYKITRKLEEDYFGVLPWKLEIKSNTNDSIRDSHINYCALKTAEKIVLNILQIKADANNNVDLSTHTIFKQYIQDLNDYELNIKTWTVTQFTNLVKNGAYRYILKDDDDDHSVVNLGRVEADFDDDGDGYYDFDMVIIGFADCFTDIGHENALKNINDFIEEGKTILFTHDTTSFVNREKGNGPGQYSDNDFWGYGLNRYFRDILGMDRFGATMTSASTRADEGKDYTSESSNGTKSYSGYIQGYSNMILNRYKESGYRGSHYYVNSVGNFENAFKTTKVSNVNHGQITKYPYEIDNNFTVATTHAQYYQLDMEASDMVVWYALSDNQNGKGLYSATPNDVRNNYYIYNKGNVTYSGVGHAQMTDHMEVKLFVNTMIAAYSATAKAAKIDVINRNSSTDASGKSYVYVDYDIYNTDLAIGSEVKDGGRYQQVKYKFTENNIIFNKKVTVAYYEVVETVNGDGSITKTDQLIHLTSRYVRDDNEVSTFHSGNEYYIMLPLSDLNDSNQSKSYKIKTTIQYGKLQDKFMVSEKEFVLMRRGLFDLD